MKPITEAATLGEVQLLRSFAFPVVRQRKAPLRNLDEILKLR